MWLCMFQSGLFLRDRFIGQLLNCFQFDVFGRSEYVCYGEIKKDIKFFLYLSFCIFEMMFLFYFMVFFGLKCIY